MVSVQVLEEALARVAAPWVKSLGLRVLETDGDTTVLALPVAAELVHGGGVLCGQAMMAAADTAMVVALSAALGGFRPMTTVQLQTSFLRPVPAGADDLRVTARVLRRGRSICFGEVEIAAADGKLVAHATTSYALL